VAGAALSGQPIARRLGWVPSGLPAPVLVGLVLGLLATSHGVEWAIAQAGLREVGTLAHIRRVLTGIGPGELAVALLGVALLPGVGEELALRGLVQRGLEPRTGAVAAVGVTAVLFGLLHGEPVHAAGAAVLGVYLGSVVALSGSVRPAVLCHVANNAVATLGTALAWERVGAALVLLGAVLGPWALWRLARHAREREVVRRAAEAAHAPLEGSPEAPPSSGADPPR